MSKLYVVLLALDLLYWFHQSDQTQSVQRKCLALKSTIQLASIPVSGGGVYIVLLFLQLSVSHFLDSFQ